MSNEMIRYTGACHCGAVCFEVELEKGRSFSRCNCSICHKLGRTGALVKPAAFRLISGENDLSDYVWGARFGEYRFCKQCGVHVFSQGHLAQLGGDFVSVNVNCLDDFDPNAQTIEYWDGRHDNWQSGTQATPWPIQA